MADVATLSAKFQISIPKAVRDARHWKPGQAFVFLAKGTGLLLVPVPDAKDLVGLAAGANADGYRDRGDRF